MEPHRTSRTTAERPAYRPPMGVPLEQPTHWATPVSLLLHVLVVLFLVSPILTSRQIDLIPQGAGGAGPAGGGGGGTRGTGGGDRAQERLRYLQVAPPPPAPVPAPTVTPPVTPPKVTPPVEQPKPEPLPTPPLPKVEVKVDVPTPPMDVALGPGTGGGTGNDGTSGNGPGTGGGIGTGVGTGRGSGNRPGTGGGEGTIYPPTPDYLPLPPQRPSRLRGDSVVLWFTLDERGRVLKLDLSSGDRAYDKRLREVYAEIRFRPATKWNGTPIAGRFPITVRF